MYTGDAGFRDECRTLARQLETLDAALLNGVKPRALSAAFDVRLQERVRDTVVWLEAERAERKHYADRAVEEFRLSLADGFVDVPLFLKDEDLDPIRDRDDFKKLLAEAQQAEKAKTQKQP